MTTRSEAAKQDMAEGRAKREGVWLYKQVDWELFDRVWRQGHVTDLAQFTAAVNQCQRRRFRCSGLRRLLQEAETTGVGNAFFTKTLPRIVELAGRCRVNEEWRWSLLLPGDDSTHVTQVTGEQAASLLANMFLCMLPSPTTYHPAMPDCNTFALLLNKDFPQEVAKLQMFVAFFEMATDEVLGGTGLTFRRARLDLSDTTIASWLGEDAPLQAVEVRRSGVIEEDPGAVQVDFANAMIGGGVLCGGCVQEEIRFSICPLFTTSLLFFSVMGPHEAIHIVSRGTTTFTAYENYAFKLRFGGRMDITRPQDPVCIAAIDAVPCPSKEASLGCMMRDMNKAYAGFRCSGEEAAAWRGKPIATGNWGCGAFGGSVWIKAVLQWLAAARAGRPLKYYVFDAEEEFATALRDVSRTLCGRGVSVAEAFAVVKSTADAGIRAPPELFDALLTHCRGRK